MFLPTIAAALLFMSAANPKPAGPALLTTSVEGHGKVAWFNGTFDEAMAKAKAEKKIVFIDFWTTWCGFCKKLDKVTYMDDSVVAAMKDIICLSIDAESEAGAPLAAKYPISGFPTMVLLEADGSVRDMIVGYRDPAPFKAEIERIRSGKGTSSDLRAQVEADKTSIDKRWTLAKKLKEFGDQKGYDEQLAEIKKLDTLGTSVPMRRAAFDETIAKVQKLWAEDKADQSPVLIEEFLTKEVHGEILWDGWNILANIRNKLGEMADQANKADEAKNHRTAQIAAWKKAWPNAPEVDFIPFGAFLAANLWARKDTLTAEDKAFALDLAKKLEPKIEKEADALDAVACCYFMNGLKEDAQKLVRKAIELDPKRPEFKARLTEFGGA